ncbi:septum formation protein Maf [bacterium]|nr:septum formation protein Maf [bacterium]
MKIILASASPRRRQILKEAGLVFEVHVSAFDEKLDDDTFSQQKIEKFALNKATDVAKNFPHDVVISADTVVVLDDKIFMKPKNRQDAFLMLKKLSGRTHFVLTSVCMLFENKKLIDSVKTYVTFKPLNDSLINCYIDNFNPLDKAGAYGIQELPDGFIERVDGDLENVIGISSAKVKEMLQNIKP